jgi:hypothetical protein
LPDVRIVVHYKYLILWFHAGLGELFVLGGCQRGWGI